ncbi:hypothetical protein BLA29_000934, partial [Euroglyphus maynei]
MHENLKKCHVVSESSPGFVPLCRKLIERSQSPEVSFFSIELFPPKTWKALDNLVPLLNNFRQLGCLFSTVTWHSNVNQMENLNDILSMQVVEIALNYCWLDTMIHLTCVGMTSDKMLAILERLKQIGIRNILALRGDLTESTDNKVEEFKHASDLVRFIRHHYGDYFTIAVAGYPIKHPESMNKQHDRENLKIKVDAGADFIITQLFFESDVYIGFVNECRAIGIEVPILPGIMPIQNYDSLAKIARLSQLDIPNQIIQDLEPIRNNDEAVRNYGIEWTIRLCRELMKSGLTPGLHFYTLNRQHATTTIVKALQIGYSFCYKPLPWQQPVNHRRCSENVRPIFWATRPESYVQRTNTWDEFPNGRWGRVHSPAFGSLNDYHLFVALDSITPKNRKRYVAMWGKQLLNEQDVWQIFEAYVAGTNNRFGHKVESLPWNDDVLAPETNVIRARLSRVNRHGILTINSQPNVNGISSSDSVHGWGSPNGYVYQKAYVEFFISGDRIDRLLEILAQYPLVNYQITNNK